MTCGLQTYYYSIVYDFIYTRPLQRDKHNLILPNSKCILHSAGHLGLNNLIDVDCRGACTTNMSVRYSYFW